jgi:hypothetical protein
LVFVSAFTIFFSAIVKRPQFQTSSSSVTAHWRGGYSPALHLSPFRINSQETMLARAVRWFYNAVSSCEQPL